MRKNHVTLNNTLEIPQIGLGVWKIPNEDVTQVALSALSLGYRHIDTAKVYGNEKGVGLAIAKTDIPREEIFVTSKLWNDDQGYDSTLRAFDETMSNLGLDVLDLYLIHWPEPSKDLYLDTWRAMIELYEQGRVSAIGTSNFNPSHLTRIIDATGVTPTVNQIELHPRFAQRNLREFHKQHAIAIESWSPLGNGRLLNDERIAVIASKHGCTIAQAILAWHLQQRLIVIPKSVNEARLAENLAAQDIILDDEDIAAFAQIDAVDGRNGADPDA